MRPIVEEVLRFEELRWRARQPPCVVRWSDGTESEALGGTHDEVLICEGDLVGKTREQIRAAAFPARPRLASVVRLAASG